MALETVPKDLRHLRACLLCSLVKTIDQFEYDGCDNCEAYVQMKGNREMVYDCTSSSFDGIVAMMSPDDSWVSKWQRIIAAGTSRADAPKGRRMSPAQQRRSTAWSPSGAGPRHLPQGKTKIGGVALKESNKTYVWSILKACYTAQQKRERKFYFSIVRSMDIQSLL
uniref:Transcription elongation factor SPT4 n=1 Tax=Leptobrachium leishanense TaxID=445787 RepID=A0A8C5QYW1_9ANUR